SSSDGTVARVSLIGRAAAGWAGRRTLTSMAEPLAPGAIFRSALAAPSAWGPTGSPPHRAPPDPGIAWSTTLPAEVEDLHEHPVRHAADPADRDAPAPAGEEPHPAVHRAGLRLRARAAPRPRRRRPRLLSPRPGRRRRADIAPELDRGPFPERRSEEHTSELQ